MERRIEIARLKEQIAGQAEDLYNRRFIHGQFRNKLQRISASGSRTRLPTLQKYASLLYELSTVPRPPRLVSAARLELAIAEGIVAGFSELPDLSESEFSETEVVEEDGTVMTRTALNGTYADWEYRPSRGTGRVTSMQAQIENNARFRAGAVAFVSVQQELASEDRMGIALQVSGVGLYRKPNEDTALAVVIEHRKFYRILPGSDVVEAIRSQLEELDTIAQEKSRDSSAFETWIKLRFTVIRYFRRMGGRGRGFVLPSWLALKQAMININAPNNECFKYAVLAARNPLAPGVDSRHAGSYRHHEASLDCTMLTYPTPLDSKMFSKFECANNVKLCVYTTALDKQDIVPIHISAATDAIPILYVPAGDGNDVGHYLWIKNISRLFGKHGSNAKHYCLACQCGFSSDEAFQNHLKYDRCLDRDEHARDVLPKKGEHIIKFNSFEKTIRQRLVGYADSETMTLPVLQTESPAKTKQLGVHAIASIGCLVILNKGQNQGTNATADSVENSETRQQEQFWFSHMGSQTDESAEAFVTWLDEKEPQFKEILEEKATMQITQEQERSFQTAETCYMCGSEFKEVKDKNRDHCHDSGQYLGAACNACNRRRAKAAAVPIFFHNGRGFDFHLLVRALAAGYNRRKVAEKAFRDDVERQFQAKYAGRELSADHAKNARKRLERKLRPRELLSTKFDQVFQNSERISQFTYGIYVFRDSAQHLQGSLDSLAAAVPDEKKKITRAQHEDETRFKLMTRKGVYPYKYITGWDRLAETSLPGRRQFYNELKQSKCSRDDYAHAQSVWRELGCRTMADYTLEYMKTDIALLGDIFENYRDTCMETYKLDPSYFMSIPGFSWQAALKHTGQQLELFYEGQEDMHRFIEKGIRGGISMISKRYARANNAWIDKYIVGHRKKQGWLLYLDANNLYGFSMKQKLPTGDFKWEDVRGITDPKLYITDLDVHGSRGFSLEVDMHCPEELHDYFSDYPLAPERMCIAKEHLSEAQRETIEREKLSGIERTPKLVPNLLPKKNYVVDARVLQFYVSMGMVVSRIHRVLSFEQSAWLESYIDLNTLKRKQAEFPYEKDLYKLLNNAVFGKTMENVRKHCNSELVTTGERLAKINTEPNRLRQVAIYDENLVYVNKRKSEYKLNKPIYCGFTILDLSKLHMYRFYYQVLKALWGERVKLLGTDTDSLIIEIETENLYEDLRKIKNELDVSEYPTRHPFFEGMSEDEVQRLRSMGKVPGLFKDECGGRQMLEWIANRPKSYYMSTEESQVHKCKGVNKTFSSSLTRERYYDCIFGGISCNVDGILGFRSKQHRIWLQRTSKQALHPLDTKRFLCEDGVHTRAIGHYKNLSNN